MADKGGFRHFMLKEIFEQPGAVRETFQPRIAADTGKISLDSVNLSEAEFGSLTKINIAASGSSRHAGLAGKFMIETLARVPTEVDYASEFAYRNPIIGKNELTIVITQSGETADTLAAQRAAAVHGSKTLAVCNVLESTIMREADAAIYTHAGPEIIIASTKAFTTQWTALFLFALYLGEVRETLPPAERRRYLSELERIPEKIESILARESECEELARKFSRSRDFLYLGRGIHFAVALDGALKLKEVSYIHAEGYPAGEMKHGPNALIDEDLPVVILATCDQNDPGSVLRYQKTLSNLKEVKARSGQVIAVANEGDREVCDSADAVLPVPSAPELLLPMLEIVPLQLLAYHIALRRGCDVDRPRNLVKSVQEE